MRTLVVGLGSVILADDGVGMHAARCVAEAVQADGLSGVDVLELGTAGLSLLASLEGYDRLILLDAIVTGAAPGTIHELSEADVAKTAHLGAGHEADLPTALAFGRRALGAGMPEDVVVIAVEAEDLTTFSEAPTPAVAAAIPEVVARVRGLLSRPRPGRSQPGSRAALHPCPPRSGG